MKEQYMEIPLGQLTVSVSTVSFIKSRFQFPLTLVQRKGGNNIGKAGRNISQSFVISKRYIKKIQEKDV